MLWFEGITDITVLVEAAGIRVDDTPTVTVHYEGTPDDGLIIRENVHGEPSAFGGDSVRRRIEVSERETKVSIPGLDEEPTMVRLDPDGWVLIGGNR